MKQQDLHQHDLTEAAAKSFVATIGVRKTDTVLEAGAGTGNLAAAILETGARVHAVELDVQRVARIKGRFVEEMGAGRLVLHAGDALTLSPTLPENWRIVSNPPFNLTAPLIRRWLTEVFPSGPPSAIDLILQFQAAKKLTPLPGAYTRSSVLSALFGSARISKKLSRDDVFPVSHVPLSGWSLVRAKDAPSATELLRIDRVLAKGFSGVHQMRQALRGVLTTPQMKRQGAENGWRLEDPPRALSPQAWRSIAGFLDKSR